MKYLITFLFFSLTIASMSNAEFSHHHDKVYIDEEQLNFRSDSFHIHVGNNEWIETSTVHRDNTGLFTFESSIQRSARGPQAAYEKKWRCPYCYSYWPIGKKCQNDDCPSKYKDYQ